MKNPFKSLFKLFSSKEKTKPLTIEEVRELKLSKARIDTEIKSRA